MSMLALADQGSRAETLDALRGKVVVLACARQQATLAALAQMDGIARRIILWPPDRPDHQIASIMDAAAVDTVVTEWPLDPDTADTKPFTPAATIAGDGAPTEWVLFTSGTTGLPKMVVHTLGSLAGHIGPFAGNGPPPVWCTFYDIRRYGGLQIALRALIGGCSLVLSDDGESVGEFLGRAAAAGASHVLGTPSHWRLALMANAHAVIAPAYVRLSGEIADQTILDSLTRAFPDAALVHAFASTEAGLAFEVSDRRAGFPLSFVHDEGPGPQMRIVDGILHVRSDRVARGLLDHKITPFADADGYVSTGDAVTIRDDRFHFAGRRDGIVNVGGQKVYPEEVEAVINRHPAVSMSRVSARRSPITGTVVSADVVCRAGGASMGAATLQQDIVRFCHTSLPPHKVPAIVKIVDSLEVAPSGKLVRVRA
jgi:acyl-coenzyme A synthetase/AMP-(fatty) acid ligase